MVKKSILMVALLAIAALFAVQPAAAQTMTCGGAEWQFFGMMKTYPTFMSNLDFNSDDTGKDWMLDENGVMSDHNVRNEIRIGFKGKGENFDFLVILESDFNLTKPNADRGADKTLADPAMSGYGFGVEKLNFTYDFGPMKIETGWNIREVDIMTGCLIYADDHPYIGLLGKAGNIDWDLRYVIQFDETNGFVDKAVINGHDSDWRFYTARALFNMDKFKIGPMYAFSDNEAANADVNYIGLQAFGPIGDMITPRAEFVYAMGEKESGETDLDIAAMAAYASVEVKLSDTLVPYFGGYYYQGDEDGSDDEINAYNSIGNAARYTPTFGMENTIMHRMVPSLGTFVYSNTPNMFGTKGSGYGGTSNTSTGDAPGMIMLGAGIKGKMDKISYKTHLLYMMLQEVGGIEGVYGTEIDDYLGMEYDLQLTYHFSKNFSMGNTISVYMPGDAVEDINGKDCTETAYVDTIELIWTF